jgi:hypothetical protein
MKLILLYGAPAVGKLTVGRELSRITGIGLAHNHLTINAAREAFGWGTPAFQRAIHRLRFVIIEEAAAEKLDLIATASYHHSPESEGGRAGVVREGGGAGHGGVPGAAGVRTGCARRSRWR